jgi:FtsP/CotA-like multicopper oxidase with cupredoxin domain
MSKNISRRGFILGSAATLLGGLGANRLQEVESGGTTAALIKPPDHEGHDSFGMVGSVDPEHNGFDPLEMLVDWDYGKVSQLPDGQTLREYQIVAVDKEIEVAPGITFPAWTYNGRVPGPTIRCTEGDRIRIHFVNAGSHPHTIHFHGVHPFEMDGVPGAGPGEIGVGQTTVYEFDAEPFGCHLYHCHAVPLKRHVHKGLYGAFIVDPKEGRPPARELLMVMNGFDTNFDGENEIYAVNTVGFEYARRPIPARVGELIRVYLINITEFDPINSFHLHAEFFDYYDHGTTLTPTLKTVDTIMQAQAQRGILEFRYRWPGRYMFHAHVTEFAELGWMGNFNIVEPGEFAQALAESGVDQTWDGRALNGSSLKHSEGS